MITKNDIFEVDIADVSFAGLGIARYSDADIHNFIIFIHNAVPGDRVLCRVVKVEKTFAYGIIERVIMPSDKRIAVICPTFDKCGGCVFLNISYEAELEIKRNFVVNAFKRSLTSFPKPEKTEPSPETVGYRNKIICPLSMSGKFGFYARASHRNIENNSCPLQDKAFSALLSAAEEYIENSRVPAYDEQTGRGVFRQLFLRSARATGEICVCAVINGKKLPDEDKFAEAMMKNGASSVYINVNTTRGNTLLGNEFRLIGGTEKITDILCGNEYEISPRAFYQINREQAEKLYNYAIYESNIQPNETVLDLFCGIGTITLTEAKAGAKNVIGIEIIDDAIKDAKRNAERNGINNALFFAADAADTLGIIEKCGGKPDVIIVDPPRKGLGDETINAIIALSPKRLVYVSCNPETQARDIAKLAPAGYALEKLKPFDMFPRTQHVENVVLMSKKET